VEPQMLAFLTIFLAGLCGYFHVSVLTWPIAAAGLMSISYAEHHLTAWRAVDQGHADLVQDTLMRSLIHALIATGGCYWLGYGVRLISGL
jgi:hypothetical protein